jgi:hypothetical protein
MLLALTPGSHRGEEAVFLDCSSQISAEFLAGGDAEKP